MTKESEYTQLEVFVKDLEKKLQSYGIPLDQWGTGKAKTTLHLAKEILAGETELVESGRDLLRRVEFVRVEVRHIDGGIELELVEDRQVFSDGRIRRRGLTAVSEKMLPGENPFTAALRAIQEEIGAIQSHDITDLGEGIEEIESPSYPGLTTEYFIHNAQVYLSEEDFDPNGYVEEQEDKTTYFLWKKLN